MRGNPQRAADGPEVVIIGGGFAGLSALQAARPDRAPG